MIYLIKQVGKPICKIGYAADPQKRIKQLQTGNDCVLQLKSVIEGDLLYERAIHKKFEKLHIRAEWFKYDKSILNYFNKVKKANGSIPARKVKSEIKKK